MLRLASRRISDQSSVILRSSRCFPASKSVDFERSVRAPNDTASLASPIVPLIHHTSPGQCRSFWSLPFGKKSSSSDADASAASATDSSSFPPSDTSAVDGSSPSVDETLDKLFQDSQAQLADASSKSDAWFAGGDEAAASAASTAVSWDPTWYNLSDQAIVAVKTFHDLTGVEYGWSIVGVTVLLRLALFPLMVSSQQTTSRMAHLQPELTLMKARYEALGTPSRQDQIQFSNQMKSLFAKYKVKPLRGFAAPLVQLPLFMGMFFGLRKMPDIYHDELATGGMFWFPDLTLTDPLYILPLASAGSFLLLIELGKDQMMAQNPAQGKLFVNVFRIMSVAMIPVCINFESAMLCYWTANNVLTLTQTVRDARSRFIDIFLRISLFLTAFLSRDIGVGSFENDGSSKLLWHLGPPKTGTRPRTREPDGCGGEISKEDPGRSHVGETRN